MNGNRENIDELLKSSLRGGRTAMSFSEADLERLLHASRPYAGLRNHPARLMLLVLTLGLSLGSFGMWSGLLPIPAFLATLGGVSQVAEREAAPAVAVPVRGEATRRRVVAAERVDAADEIDRAIANALDYLVAAQRADGSYPGDWGASTALPSLAGMAILSRGAHLDDPRYGATLGKCLDYVLSHANLSDFHKFKGYMGEVGNGRMYAHSIATLFLSECSGMVDKARQERIDAVLPHAVRVILAAQNQNKAPAHLGGWRYQPDSKDSDLSCSGWALMALKSARQNGAPVPDEAIEKAVLYIRRVYDDRRGTFGYQGANSKNAETLSGAAILCLELCGQHLDPASLKAAKFLRGCYQKALVDGESSVYGLYYAAQGLFQVGGDIWKEFEEWMYATYLQRQQPDGSWAGKGNQANPVYATAMTVLAFTVPYRMLPIYQRDETVDY